MEYKDQRKKVSDFWAETRAHKIEKGLPHIAWLESQYILKNYVHRLMSGDLEKNFLIYVSEKYFKKPVETGLSIGCGDGGLERHALKLNICKKFEAFDISVGAIEKAKELINKENLGDRVYYGVKDFNTEKLKENYYDVVFGSSSIHHIKNLEFLYEQVNKALKPDGFFIMNEYVGPSQFQWTERQCEFVTKILNIFPVNLKKSLDKDYGRIKNEIEKTPKEIMTQNDPSEAIRSAEIIPLFGEWFDVIERIDWGGTILHPLFHKIIGNFDVNDEKDRAIIDLICLFEHTLIREKIIPSDFALIVGRKK